MQLPSADGLYNPLHEHDACGLGFVAELSGAASHRTIERGIGVLKRLAHRGAAGADPLTGDGAGVLTQLPHAFFQRVCTAKGQPLPAPGDYGVAQVFLSRDATRRYLQMKALEDIVRHHRQEVIGWRDVPTDLSVLGPTGFATLPSIKQLFIARTGRVNEPRPFERTLFLIRKRAGRVASAKGYGDDFYVASCSARTVVYKGLMLPERVADFYTDLRAEDYESAIAMVHSRFSTNTFPTWERAHPYRRIAHNGEINTLRGNRSWMSAREALLASRSFGEHLEDFKPILRPDGSDSASLDNLVDFLLASGRSLPHVMMMLVPEAVSDEVEMDPAVRDFYAYHAALVEPWDGPAALAFTDGIRVGACLDRNGLRPAKYVVTKGGLVVLASELGVLDLPEQEIVEKGRLSPGKMLLVDTARNRLLRDEEIKLEVAAEKPYGAWLAEARVTLGELPEPPAHLPLPKHEREHLARVFGYTREELRALLAPMADAGAEPVGSMGNDASLAVLSDRPQVLFHYFKQQFAQVTNPPIDPIRESLVMSLGITLGGEGNLLDDGPRPRPFLELSHPVLTQEELQRLIASPRPDFRVAVVPARFPATGDPAGALEGALDDLCDAAEAAVDGGASVVVISDRGSDAEHVPIPSLLAVSAVHHHLIANRKRVLTGLAIESGEAREVADLALLVGYGANAVCPYLALEWVGELQRRGDVPHAKDAATAQKYYVKALTKGLLKVLSKMGISTVSAYHGAQIFEALGLGKALVERYFPGTPSLISGVGLSELADEARARHRAAYAASDEDDLHVGGIYAWRAGGERHLWTPDTVANLQHAVRAGDVHSYESYARYINEQPDGPVTLRRLWELRPVRPAVDLDEVEPAAHIVRRFATGAMSFGSISKEAHENLAIAMNRIGGRSNTGEGGEDEARYLTDANGDLRRSAIKQVASGRFGVTAHYLVNADEIQIKMAQGAKPGEGGQLPGHKVDAIIARVRHSTPGVTLISPPPHHDIYSIEDLAQLIFDLRTVSPRARISVKLVSTAGVGTIAAGVAKAHADAILISGHDGGTGASPLSSIQHAGTPWELGLAEAQQVLVKNGLRDRVVLQADGQLKTGRDVAIAALLGAEEFGFATAPLVASGCIMMRKCHLNTCPVGVATQDPVLRARFAGKPEHVIRYFFYVAEELRQLMATLGFHRIEELVGRTDCLVPRDDVPAKARLLDFSDVLHVPAPGAKLHYVGGQPVRRVSLADERLLEAAHPALTDGAAVRYSTSISNAERAFGTLLAGRLAERWGRQGLPDDTLRIEVRGTAGQSFGTFATRGMTLSLEGAANDYVGKGLSGGILAVFPPREAAYRAEDSTIVGNTVLYGATSGWAFFRGRAGERFAVRNSGARSVVEGVGDHGCEYMTGGVVVVLGGTGRNFAAGMSGGVAYVLDEDGAFSRRVNPELVELEPLDEADRADLITLVEEHVRRTGSEKGARVLAGLRAGQGAPFVKVMPVEYRRVSAAARQSTAAAAAKGNVSHG